MPCGVVWCHLFIVVVQCYALFIPSPVMVLGLARVIATTVVAIRLTVIATTVANIMSTEKSDHLDCHIDLQMKSKANPIPKPNLDPLGDSKNIPK